MRTSLVATVFSSVLAISSLHATSAPEWSAWEQMNGSGRLSMRSIQTSNAGCAFAFRNDSSLRLNGARIRYTHNGKVDNDILPALRPGQALGGWAAFSVEDQCSNVQVSIYDENWQ